MSKKEQAPVDEKVDFPTFVAIWNMSQKRKLVLPSLHERIAQWLEETESHPYRLLMAYRHSGKSFLKDLYIAWRLYKDPNFTVILISAAASLVKKAAIHVKGVIANHPLTKHLVPPTYTGQWQNDIFSVVRPTTKQEPSVTITSLGSQFTGMHADLMIIDDIETSSNSRTSDNRQRIRDAASEFVSMADYLLFIGTPHAEDTIYKVLQHQNNYTVAKYPIFVEGTNEKVLQSPDWHADSENNPTMTSEEWVMKKKRGGGAASDGQSGHNWWLSQYLLIPKQSTDSILEWSMVKFLTGKVEESVGNWKPIHSTRQLTEAIDGKEIRMKKAYWDPAKGGKGNDQSIVAFCAKTYDNELLYIDAAVLPPLDPKTGFENQINAAISFLLKHEIKHITVETNYSPDLVVQLRKKIEERGLRIAVAKDTRTNSQKKEIYIGSAIEPYLNVGKLYVHEKVITFTNFKTQFVEFPDSRHDDVLDALAGCINALGKMTGNATGQSYNHYLGQGNVYQPVYRV
jgi:hypothetical protein